MLFILVFILQKDLKMAGKQAKTLTKQQLAAALAKSRQGRFPHRDRVMILLSVLAGLRAGEIAGLTWPMVLTAEGKVGRQIELQDAAAKMGSGRVIPIHPSLRTALIRLRRRGTREGPVIRSARGGAMRASSVVNWFGVLYGSLGFEGCSSHSGRRTFITQAARLVFRVGGSLRDVQQLAGHRSIEQTQGYIEGDASAKHRLVALL